MLTDEQLLEVIGQLLVLEPLGDALEQRC